MAPSDHSRMIRAAFDERVKSGAVRKPLVLPLLACTTVDKRYLPGRGILCSILVHSFVVYGLLFVSASANFIEPPYPPMRVTMVNLKDPNYKLYLPVLLGADPPPPETREPAPPPERPNEFSYPGPQRIISDFPKPTNRIQTILQPALKDPPVVPPPLNLPNIVQLADAAPTPAAKLFDAVKTLDLQAAPPALRPEVKTIELPAK